MKRLLIITSFCLTIATTASATTNEYVKFEHKVPTKEKMTTANKEFIRYCSACHGKTGEGKTGPSLQGNLIATGPMGSMIHYVITGEPHTVMPAWGLTELSNEALADILTYVRNSWGNNDKKEYGKHAGGVVTPELIKKYRETLKKMPARKNIRI